MGMCTNMDDFSFMFYILSGLMFVIIVAVLYENENFKKFYKGIVLFTIITVGLTIFVYILNDIRVSLKINQSIDNINKIIDNLNKDNVIEFIEQIKRINVVDSAGIAIFSLLATVWVGLSIYNVMDKEELKDLMNKSKITEKRITEDESKLEEFKDELYKTKKDYEDQFKNIVKKSNDKLSDSSNELEKIKKEYKIDLNKELFYEALNDFMNNSSYYTRVKERFNKYIESDDKNEDLIELFCRDALSKALYILEITNRIKKGEKYYKDDIKKLYECAYAIEHCVEKSNYLIEKNFVNKKISDAVHEYEGIKEILKNNENGELEQDIKYAISTMNKAIKKYNEFNDKR